MWLLLLHKVLLYENCSCIYTDTALFYLLINSSNASHMSIIDIYRTIEFNFKEYVWAVFRSSLFRLVLLLGWNFTWYSKWFREQPNTSTILLRKKDESINEFIYQDRERKITTKRYLLLHKIRRLDIFVLVIEQIVCVNSNL